MGIKTGSATVNDRLLLSLLVGVSLITRLLALLDELLVIFLPVWLIVAIERGGFVGKAMGFMSQLQCRLASMKEDNQRIAEETLVSGEAFEQFGVIIIILLVSAILIKSVKLLQPVKPSKSNTKVRNFLFARIENIRTLCSDKWMPINDVRKNLSEVLSLANILTAGVIVGAVSWVLVRPQNSITELLFDSGDVPKYFQFVEGLALILAVSAILLTATEAIGRIQPDHSTKNWLVSQDWLVSQEMLFRFLVRSIIVIFFWVLHFSVRFLTRVFLLFLVPVLAIMVSLSGIELLSVLLTYLQGFIDGNVTKIAVFVTAGLVSSMFLTTFRELIGRSLADVGTAVGRFVYGIWTPTLELCRNLAPTWTHIGCALNTVWQVFKSSVVILVSGVMLVIVLLLVYSQARDFSDWQTKVVERLGRIEQGSSSDYRRFAEKIPVVFSLMYPHQGDLDSKVGICPSGENLKWIHKFKSAIAELDANDYRLKLKVQAFASIAPVKLTDENVWGPNSDWFNREIANQRGRAVVEILTAENKEFGFEECANFLRSTGPSAINEWGSNTDLINRRWEGHDVIFKPWKSYDHMTDFRPVNDGVLGVKRRHSAELFNRVVKIIVTNESGWRRKWLELIGKDR